MNDCNHNKHYLNDDEIKNEELKILASFDSFCRAYNLHYSLAYGTLLGAVRHSGFIPWDDDIDVCMPRPDYEKLISNANGLFEKEHLQILNCRNDSPYPIPFSKIINPSIKTIEQNLLVPLDEFLWIDVFPVDGVDSNTKKYKKILEQHWRRMFLLGIGLYRGQTATKEILQKVIRLFIPSPIRLAKSMDATLRSIDFANTSYVSDIAGSDPGKNAVLPKDGFLHNIEMEFEGKKFPVMSCWEEHLESIYGDYMQLPPIEKRKGHQLKAWKA